ncbi:DUF475 domain-containing protein [Pseudoclavibacter helvolus]|uniref:DUF475 domain-containing protein n=1 Tax=Pseudoclavibacter helvolus TaxID=255205 RepID=A0A7W4YG82_9MICO|nr:hypothetical protein [Pseudoclavibacter helvolus]
MLAVVVGVVVWEMLRLQIAVAFLFTVVLEIAMGVKSSVPMAGVASRIDDRSRRVFLTFGIVLGVVFDRLLIPELAVAAEHLSTGDVGRALREIVDEPDLFAADLLAVRPLLAAFGAVFVWLVFAEYLFNTDRTERRAWLGAPEAALARVERPWLVSAITAAAGATTVAVFVEGTSSVVILAMGAAGGATYALSKGISRWARRSTGRRAVSVHAGTVIFERALVIFLMCEILDGVSVLQSMKVVPQPILQILVVGAAVTVGAVVLARASSRVVEAEGLSRNKHLRAGAAYVLGVLSIMLWASLLFPIPGIIAAWVGTVIILAAFVTSWQSWDDLRASLLRRTPTTQSKLTPDEAELPR